MIKYFIPAFNCGGRCAEVISLYQKAFDLKIDWQGKEGDTGRIIHSEAHIGNLRVRLSDCGGEHDSAQDEPLFVTVAYRASEELEKAFDVLKDGGTVIQTPHKPAHAIYVGELKDKFGFRWRLTVE
jgi:PhnB protein